MSAPKSPLMSELRFLEGDTLGDDVSEPPCEGTIWWVRATCWALVAASLASLADMSASLAALCRCRCCSSFLR